MTPALPGKGLPSLIDPESLAATLDRVNACLFDGISMSVSRRLAAARWIAGRFGGLRAYRGLYAPTPADLERGFRVFTGEVLAHAAARHVAGEEAARTLIALGADDPAVRDTLARAASIIGSFTDQGPRGWYCCGNCTIGYWRYLAVSPLAGAGDLLAQGVRTLKAHRAGEGTWRPFPFHYTLLALLDLDFPEALDELRYAAMKCERALRRRPGGDTYAQRRRALAERVLAKV